MEPINILQEFDSDESSFLSLRDLPLHSNGEPHESNNPFSPPPDLIDFSFQVPPAEEENKTSKFPPFVHRRAESLNGNDGEAHAVDYRQLRRASSEARPTPAAGRRRRWPCCALGAVKHPAELEMRDMRRRQRRRGPSEVVESGGRRSCWNILHALSCKAAESTAAAPLGPTDRAPVASACRGIFGRSGDAILKNNIILSK